MNGISGTSHWAVDHASNANGAGAQRSTGASFEQALKAGGASDHRAYAFNELGMFGTQRALDLPAAGSIESVRSADSIVSPSPIPASKTERFPTDTPLADLEAAPESSTSFLPLEPGEEVRPTRSTQIEAVGLGNPSLVKAIDPGPVSPKETLPVSVSARADARVMAVADKTEALAEPVVPEKETGSAFVEQKPEATQSTETWLTLNIADGLVSLAMRDIDAADQNTDRLKARIEDVLAEHGLGLSTFTLNGAEAPDPKITRKGA